MWPLGRQSRAVRDRGLRGAPLGLSDLGAPGTQGFATFAAASVAPPWAVVATPRCGWMTSKSSRSCEASSHPNRCISRLHVKLPQHDVEEISIRVSSGRRKGRIATTAARRAAPGLGPVHRVNPAPGPHQAESSGWRRPSAVPPGRSPVCDGYRPCVQTAVPAARRATSSTPANCAARRSAPRRRHADDRARTAAAPVPTSTSSMPATPRNRSATHPRSVGRSTNTCPA